MKLNRKRTENYLKTFDFESLFIEELGWDTLDHLQIPLEVQEQSFPVETIAQKRGFTVYQCVSETIPERKLQKQLDRQLTEYSQSHLLIFTDQAQTKQVWMWVKQEPEKTPKPTFHTYMVGKGAEALIQKLEALAVDISEEEDLTLVDVVQRVKSGFNIEQVTKQFFQDFEGLHQNFCLEIEGIEDSGDRRWYASVLLNRLMFVYFLQRRYFLDGGNSEYLQHKLAECQESDRPFYGFLKDLFFEGFAKLEADRHPEIRQRLGKICYLNGGLFLRHAIEQKYPQIEIKNQAFRHVLDLFSRYSWHLNDRPDAEKESNEINPDVLGYIFEKYINQKEFGAYYTRPQITEYLCDRTINKLILDRVNRRANQEFTDIEQLLEGLDDSLCHLLLKDILPQLSLLDPACGSGAFLVAAMKTLIPIYQQVINRVAHSTDEKLSVDPPKSPLKRETFANAPFFKGGWGDQNIPHNSENGHNSLEYYIKKRIITDNLYGVDIMEEATEIAKLRLFLALVASVERVEDLEPLPNVDFNIMAGNSLIGLIRVDGDAFNRLGEAQKQTSAIEPTQLNLLGKTFIQGNLLNSLAASEYEKILAEKNKSIELYKKHAFLSDEQRDAEERSKDQSILALRNHIDEINRESQVKLNQILLDEFSTKLGIKYEQEQLPGKPQKRVLNRADIDALEPFHWGYHFDKVFARGGFDAIIANPPWEIFKPQAKEFFARYSALVTKNKMDIKTFEKEQEKLLQDPEVAAAWCEYKSQFPHVSLYYRSAQEYQNQISVVNGRKQGTDINLYKLFLERCFHLLRSGGECGIVIPSGIYTDLGTKQLRELLFSQTQVTGLFCFENRKAIFEGVDSRFKFVVLSFEKGGKTQSFPTRFMRHEVQELLDFPGADDIHLDVDLIRRLSPDSLSVMEFKSEIDLQIAQKMTRFPLLGETIAGKWNLKLNTEFHMTNDSHLFKTDPGEGRLPLYEGKMIHQFTHLWGKPKYWLDESDTRKKLIKRNENDIGQVLSYQTYKLGFRDIARNTDQRTAIITMLPKGVCCNHKIPTAIILNDDQKQCHKSELFFCCILNSFAIDYLLRQRVTTNLTFFFLYQLPVPRLQEGDPWFNPIVERAAKLICTTPEFDDLAAEVGLGSHHNGVTDETERGKLRAELDGIIAHLYGLTATEFAHILTTFPIVADKVKQAALNAYRDVPSP